MRSHGRPADAPGAPRRRLGGNGVLFLPGALVAAYLVVPVAYFVARFATASNRGLSTPGLFDALWVSVATACVSTALVTLCGVPLAYLLARSRSRWAAVLGVLVQLPLAVPPVMSGIMLIYLVGPYAPVGRLFAGRLTESLAGIVLAQSFVSAPFLVVTARSAFRAVDPALLDTAATLGRGPRSRFLTVALPAAAEGVRAGMLLTWLRAFGEYGATVILAYHPYSLPVFTYVQFSGNGLTLTAAPTVLALAVAAAVLALSRVRPGRLLARRSPEPPPAARPAQPAGSPAPLRLQLDLRLGGFHLELAAVAPSGRLAVIGPSGSGKSATLRCIAGLEQQGRQGVWLGGRALQPLPPELRSVGYVAQGLLLFPHLDVWGQVCFGAGADPALASFWLERFGVGELARRRPDELSGGQLQRVRLAQALARSPSLLLLDEPFSALDVPVREGLRRELRRLQQESAMTTVLVTHDPAEAAMLAEDVVVLAAGRVLQTGPRHEVFSAPASPAAARLLGHRNLADGVVRAPGRLAAGAVELAAPTGGLGAGTPVVWSVLPQAVRLSGAGEGHEAVVEEVVDLGLVSEVVVRLIGGPALTLQDGSGVRARAGERCRVELDAEGILVWSGEAG